MHHIDERRLDHDVAYRFQYLTGFVQFGEMDLAALAAVRTVLAAQVAGLVDAVYDKLAMYDCTWRHFLPAQDGTASEPVASLAALTPDHAHIQVRKQHLARYLERLVNGPYDAKLVLYLDMVGKIHTPAAGQPTIQVPLIHINALLGFVADALIATLLAKAPTTATGGAAIRAFSKLLWIQNDFVSRHYVQPVPVE